MDIYILRDGQQIGPFSEETTQTLLRQGSVAGGDFAWSPGMAKWEPLSDVLSPAPGATTSALPSPPPAEEPVETAPAPEPPRNAEPATEKQKAFFSYLGITFSPDLTKDQASMLVNDAMEDPKNTARLQQWNEDRLRMHPELFAAEIQAKKENRAHHFFELCQTEGAEYFTKITKAHCQVLVGFLDVKFPNWDAREAEAAENYFYPAIAEKFPQLVQKQWRGKFHYAEGKKATGKITRQTSTAELKKTAASPIAAVARGIVFGILILGVLYLVHQTMQERVEPAPVTDKPAEPAASVAPTPSETPETPPLAPAQPVVNAAPPVEPARTTPENEATPAKTATTAAPAPETGMNPSAMTPNTAPGMNAGDPTMAPMAMTTAPMASLPGAEPPVPVAPPAATLPTPANLGPSNPEPTPAPMANMPAPGMEPSPATGSAKTNLLLTRPIEIPSPYGTIKLAVGTPVKLVARQGTSVKVGYLNNVFTVPVTSTDLEGDAAPLP